MIRVLFYLWMVLFLLLCGCTSKTADKTNAATNDSIKKYLDLAGNESLDFEKRKGYNNKAYSYLDLNKNDSLTRWNLYTIGIYNGSLLQFKMLENNSNVLYDLSLKSSDELSLAYAYKLRGLNYMYKSENVKAIQSLYKSKKIFLRFNATERLISLNKDIAFVQFFSCDFLGSNKTLFENLEFIKKSKKSSHIDLYRNYTTIASNFSSLKDYKSSISFEKIALEYTDKKLKYMNISYLGIAGCYIELKDYNKALYYINKILNNPDSRFVSPVVFYSTKSTLGHLKLMQNRMDGLPKVFYEVEDYYSKNENTGGQDINQINLSEYYSKIKDTSNAIRAAERALTISKSYKNPSNVLFCLVQLIKIDKKRASANAQKYIQINDSLHLAERRFRNKFAQIIYETNEITKEKETAIKQKWIIVSISGVLILIIALLLIITRQRSKQRDLQFLQSQQKANEEIYDLMLEQKNNEELARQSEKKRIAIELHDGVMNKLASTRLNLNILSHKKDEQTIEKCLPHIEGIYKIEQEIRNIAHDLNQEVFNENNSFIPLLNDFISTQNNTTDTHYQIEIDKSINWVNLSGSIKMNLYRIIQEASHNINKFAQAKNAIISLLHDDNNLCLSITDDGKGFDIEKQTEGIGLKNIKQRVESLNGKFVIHSKNSKKTSLNIAIPFT